MSRDWVAGAFEEIGEWVAGGATEPTEVDRAIESGELWEEQERVLDYCTRIRTPITQG